MPFGVKEAAQATEQITFTIHLPQPVILPCLPGIDFNAGFRTLEKAYPQWDFMRDKSGRGVIKCNTGRAIIDVTWEVV